MIWLAVTVLVYVGALRLQTRWRWANPMAVAAALIALALSAGHIPYSRYQAGTSLFTFLIGPATVALGVPLYQQFRQLGRRWPYRLLVISAGSLVGTVSAGLTAWACGAPAQVVLSTLPKSVTTPIAMQASSQLHGNPTLTATLVLLTGLLGSVASFPVLRWARIEHDDAIGSAVGASSHGLGTATLARHSADQAAASSLAMALTGLVTAALAMLYAGV